MDLKNNKILVIGDVMLDRYVIGNVERISPEAPVPVVHVTHEKNTLGGAANVANNLASLGVHVSLFGGIADDNNGLIVKDLLNEKSIADLLVTKDFPCTITKTRIVANHQQITRVDREQKLSNTEVLKQALSQLNLSDYNLIILSDYDKGVCSESICQQILQSAKSKGVRVIVDPKGRNWGKYDGAFIITPNLKELSDVILEKVPNQDEPVCAAAYKLKSKFNLEHLLVTRSEKGMTLIGESSCQHYSAEAQDVFDVSGAGDTVVAVLAYAINLGLSLEQSVNLANKAAAYVVSKFGTHAITSEELSSLK